VRFDNYEMRFEIIIRKEKTGMMPVSLIDTELTLL